MRYVLLAWQRDHDGVPYARAHDEQVDVLRKSGYIIAMALLQPLDSLRVCAGGVHIRTTPHERLAALFMIEARDLNDAVRIASRISYAPLGWTVEVLSAVSAPGTPGSALP